LANLATTVAAQVKIIQSGAVRPLIDMGMNTSNQIEARRYAVLALANLTGKIPYKTPYKIPFNH
jgi:hypothetical protein